ncbi:hypothetical protein LRS73_17860 [Methylobacterium currus]|nr:hypothetical protein [Methylobacterium currus]UHC14421.1 hypothetical protein LRS73_17860 [Methylobacterium currus]
MMQSDDTWQSSSPDGRRARILLESFIYEGHVIALPDACKRHHGRIDNKVAGIADRSRQRLSIWILRIGKRCDRNVIPCDRSESSCDFSPDGMRITTVGASFISEEMPTIVEVKK